MIDFENFIKKILFFKVVNCLDKHYKIPWVGTYARMTKNMIILWALNVVVQKKLILTSTNEVPNIDNQS
jgi:hypothetical protein